MPPVTGSDRRLSESPITAIPHLLLEVATVAAAKPDRYTVNNQRLGSTTQRRDGLIGSHPQGLTEKVLYNEA